MTLPSAMAATLPDARAFWTRSPLAESDASAEAVALAVLVKVVVTKGSNGRLLRVWESAVWETASFREQ